MTQTRALVTGSVLLLVSLALLAGGGTLVWADEANATLPGT
jgi:hypothetical protein